MSRILEEDVDELVDADDWSTVVADSRERQRRELEAKVAEFKRNGGRIHNCAPGETALPEGKVLFTITKETTKHDPAMQKRHEEDQFTKLKQRLATDAKAVNKLNELLGNAENMTQICDAMACSPNRVQRLVRDHFADDPRADRFRAHLPMEERKALLEAELLPKISKCIADGVVGIHKVAELCGTSFEMVRTIEKKHRLRIERQKGGRKVDPAATVENRVKRTYVGKVVCSNAGCGARMTGLAYYCPHCGTATARGLAKGIEDAAK